MVPLCEVFECSACWLIGPSFVLTGSLRALFFMFILFKACITYLHLHRTFCRCPSFHRSLGLEHTALALWCSVLTTLYFAEMVLWLSQYRYTRINDKMARQKTYEKRRDEWYRNGKPGEQTTASGRYSNFANTLQEIVRENNQEIKKEKERLENFNKIGIRKCWEEKRESWSNIKCHNIREEMDVREGKARKEKWCHREWKEVRTLESTQK